MISPTENEKFAIPLVEKSVSRDSGGNFVPRVIRDSIGRIKNASGLIKGGNLPKGDQPSEVTAEMLGSHKAKYIQQIIPSIWGGGNHVDNLVFPSHKQVCTIGSKLNYDNLLQIKTKTFGLSKLDEEIAEHLSKPGSSVIFSFDYKYEDKEVIPCKTRKFIDLVQDSGDRIFLRNGAEYKLANFTK